MSESDANSPVKKNLIPAKKPAWLHWTIRIGRVVVVWYLFTILFTWWAADILTYPAPAPSYDHLEGQVQFPSGDGTPLIGVWLPAEKPKATILFSHGNGEDLGLILPFLNQLRDLGVNVFSYDYRGYGRSGGKAHEAGLYLDAEAAYDFVTKEKQIAPDRLFVFGRSLGSGSATYLASTRPVAGLITEGAFTSTFRVVLPHVPLPNDQFKNKSRMRMVTAPVLLIHAQQDQVIPFSHGQELADLLGKRTTAFLETLWVPGAGHNDIVPIAGETYFTTINNFINRVLSYQPKTQAKISGATIVASDSTTNFGVSIPSLPHVIFSFGTAPE
jgi:fermentation-respiration switch protein FrsA (DUF1100 family)